jgi:uncharacterized membrane protein
MPTAYHRIAGTSLERLAALSDGIFAVVMTLLVLDLHVPVVEGLHSEAALWHELGRLAPQLLSYLLSFLTLGIFWVGQQTQLNQLARSNQDLTWIYLGFLLAVSLMPFSTGLLAEFITFRLALGLYWLNLLLLGVLLFCFCLLIGMISTYAAIALLVLLQLNSAVAPRIRPLDRF